MLLRRVVANCIDLFVLIGGTAVGIYLSGLMNALFEGDPFLWLTISQVCVIILIPIGIQSLFWMESTTLGKMMTFTRVIDEQGEKLNYMAMFTREYLSKVLSCYIVCLPVFAGKPGLHETISYSHVQLNYIKKRG